MILTTDSFATFDICPRLETFTTRYQPLRVSINYALNEALHSALATGQAITASDTFTSLATSPGIDLPSEGLYQSVIHHSRLVELLATYIISIEKVATPSPIQMKWGMYQPKSFLTDDGRLRRIILCDKWTADRARMERFSWRTAADTSITNLPMLLTAIVIGGLRSGKRHSPWTQGYAHPANGEVRIQKRQGEFNDNWRMVWREETDVRPLEWLRLMQNDGVFGEVITTVMEDVPRNRESVLDDLGEMAKEIQRGSMRQTRSSCYRFKPCPFLPACSTAQSPAQLGWIEKI